MKHLREEREVQNLNMGDYSMLFSHGYKEEKSPSRDFECQTCDRRFQSFQALGGHRASHKKQKVSREDEKILRKPKTHECPICGIEFSMGQALGGHMRRHRARNDGFSPAPTVKRCNSKRVLCFDLNLPARENDDTECPSFDLFGHKIHLISCTH